MIELSHTAEKTVKRYLHKTARKEKNMSIKMYVNGSDRKGHINPEIYGHFSEHLGRCIYNGIYVGEDSSIPNTKGIRNDIVEAFKNIKMPVLRWPGGCFADEYHWKDGIGEKSQRKKMINTHWGGVTEDNSFGTHEFFDFCEMVGCEPYLSGNLGSGTVQEMSEWFEYMTFDGVSPMADLRKENGRLQEKIAEISRSRKRELGLWRKYVAGAVFRTLQAVSDVLQKLRGKSALQGRLRTECG